MFVKYLIVFLVSMVPLIELRGAIPYAIAFHGVRMFLLSLLLSSVVSVLKRVKEVNKSFFLSLRMVSMLHYSYL